MALARFFASFRTTLPQFNHYRSITFSATRNLKEIRETVEGNTTIVEGILVPDENEHLMMKPKGNGACILCSLGVDVKHTDVLVLKQFVRSDGCMLPRRITGLCKTQQRRVGIMVAMAHKAGLMGNLKPKGFKGDPRKRFQHKAFNTYYDENTIKYKYYN